MSSGAGSPSTGAELIKLVNSENTQQHKYASLTDIAEFVALSGSNADVLMIALLQDISKKLDGLGDMAVDLKINNMYLSKITGEHFTDQDIES